MVFLSTIAFTMDTILPGEIILLLRTMSDRELKLFKKEVKKKLQPQNLELYRLITKHDTEDDLFLVKKFFNCLCDKTTCTCMSEKQLFQTLKSNLKHCIKEFLIEQERKKIPFSWFHDMEEVEMLFNRKSFAQAYKKNNVLIAEITKHNITGGNLMLAKAQVINNHLIPLVADERSHRNHKKNIETLISNVSSIADSVISYNIYFESTYLHQNDLFLRNDENKKRFKNLKSGLSHLNPDKIPSDQKFYYTAANASISLIEGDYEAMYNYEMPHWKERVEQIKSGKNGINENERMKDWNNVLDACYFAGKTKGLESLLNEGYELFKNTFAYNPEYHNTWLVFRFKLMQLKNSFDDSGWYNEAQHFYEINSNNKNVSKLSKISISYCLMLYCFYNEDYNSSKKLRNSISRFYPKPDVMVPVQDITEIFSLFIYYEMLMQRKKPAESDYKTLVTEAKRLIEKYRKLEDNYELELALAKFFISPYESYKAAALKQRFIRFKNNLKTHPPGYLKHFNKFFDLSGWIEKQIRS